MLIFIPAFGIGIVLIVLSILLFSIVLSWLLLFIILSTFIFTFVSFPAKSVIVVVSSVFASYSLYIMLFSLTKDKVRYDER